MDLRLNKWLSAIGYVFLGWCGLKLLAAIHGLLPILIWLLACFDLLIGVWLQVDPQQVRRLCPAGFAETYLEWIASWCGAVVGRGTTHRGLADHLRLHSESDFFASTQHLKQMVWGHDQVIDRLMTCLQDQVRLRLVEVNSLTSALLASFMLVGAAGIGKRHLVQSVASQLYRTSDVLLIRCGDETEESLLGSAIQVGRLISSLRMASARVVLWEDFDQASEELQRCVLAMMNQGCAFGVGSQPTVRLNATVFAFTIAQPVPGLATLSQQSTTQRQFHDKAVELVASAIGIASDLLRTVTAIYACDPPNDLTKARVVAAQLIQTCQTHGVQLNQVASSILAVEVLRLTTERGFADVRVNAQRLLSKPLLSAKQANRAQLSLQVDGEESTLRNTNRETD